MHSEDYKNNRGVTCIYVTAIIVLVLFNIPSFVWIGYAVQYKDQITCNPYVNQTNLTTDNSNSNLIKNIGIFPFVLVNSITNFIESIFIFFVIVFLISPNQDDKDYHIRSRCFGCGAVLCEFFRIIWLCVGAYMFWHDCKNLAPIQMNNMIWALLILGFIGSFLSFCGNCKLVIFKP